MEDTYGAIFILAVVILLMAFLRNRLNTIVDTTPNPALASVQYAEVIEENETNTDELSN